MLPALRYLRRAARLVLSNPAEGLDRLRNRLENTRQHSEPYPYATAPQWDSRLHAMLRSPWPCPDADAFPELWEATERGLGIDKLPFGEYHDADPALARAAWCLTTHLRPHAVVETGVARGVVTSFILRALAASGRGHLWSIDLPPLQEDWYVQAAAAVPEDVRPRGTLTRGSSRRRLPSLPRGVGQIDMFVHDTPHPRRNMSLELRLAWEALR